MLFENLKDDETKFFNECVKIFLDLDANFIPAFQTKPPIFVLFSGIISLGFAGLAFFHLLTHALFKALLFICAEVLSHKIGISCTRVISNSGSILICDSIP